MTRKVIAHVTVGVLALPLVGIPLLMILDESVREVGAILTACALFILVAIHSAISKTADERAKMVVDAKKAAKAKRIETDARGVHWFWWLFWFVVFFPALIVVAIMHTGRKNRAAIREAKEQNNDL